MIRGEKNGDSVLRTSSDDIPCSSQTLHLKNVVIRHSTSTTVILRPSPSNNQPSQQQEYSTRNERCYEIIGHRN